MYKSLYDTDEIGLTKEYSLYGAILFTEAHPHIIKCLKDEEYWNALNEISGDDFPVFANKLFPGSYGYPNLRPGEMGLMYQIWKEPRQNKEVLEWFCLKDSKEPLLVIFGFEVDTMFQVTYKLSNENVEKAYESIKTPIEAISKKISEFNLPENSQKLYKEIKFNVSKNKVADIAKKTINILATIRGAIGI